MSETMGPMAIEVDQQELAQQLLAQAKEQGLEIRQARSGRAGQREFTQRHPFEDRADGDRAGGNRCAPGYRFHV